MVARWAIGGGDRSVFDDAESVLLRYARAVEAGSVLDESHAARCRHYTPAEVAAVGLLVDCYVGLCNSIASAELPVEGGEIVGWRPGAETVSRLFGQRRAGVVSLETAVEPRSRPSTR